MMRGHGSGWTPCARCRNQKDRCTPGSCKYAPYFPFDQPEIFEKVHAIFGGHKAVTTLEEIPEDKRAAAVTNMFHDAVTRLKDPINGCSGKIRALEAKIRALEAEIEALKSQRTAPIREVGGLQMHQSQATVALTGGVQMLPDQQIAALKQEVAFRNAEIESLNGLLELYDLEIPYLTGQLADRDAEVKQLKDLLKAAQSNSNPNQ